MSKISIFRSPAVHKLFMLAGFAAVTVTIYLAWTLLNRIEPQAIDILREQILAELDMQSFYRQLQALEAEERQAGAEYSPQQLEILHSDMRALQNETRTAADNLQRLHRTREELARNIKITLLVTLTVLSASLVLIIFGFIGWRFRIRVIEEVNEQ